MTIVKKITGIALFAIVWALAAHGQTVMTGYAGLQSNVLRSSSASPGIALQCGLSKQWTIAYGLEFLGEFEMGIGTTGVQAWFSNIYPTSSSWQKESMTLFGFSGKYRAAVNSYIIPRVLSIYAGPVISDYYFKQTGDQLFVTFEDPNNTSWNETLPFISTAEIGLCGGIIYRFEADHQLSLSFDYGVVGGYNRRFNSFSLSYAYTLIEKPSGKYENTMKR